MGFKLFGSMRWAAVLVAGITLCFFDVASAEPYMGAGTKKMAERLRELADKSDPLKNPFLNQKRAEIFGQQMNEATDVSAKLKIAVSYANEQVMAGNSAGAVDTLLSIRHAFSQPNVRASAQSLRTLNLLLGTAYFRLGEQENCQLQHNVDSCLLPIQGGGVHTLPRGSRASIDEWLALLKENPNDIRARWLLNLSYMTLGEYPAGVPKEYVIPPQVFESDAAFPRFYDVASQTGLAKVGLAGGAIVDDFDDDGYLDVMSSSWGLMDQIRFFHNNHDGTFSDRTESAGLIGIVGGLQISHADYNNDGHLDVLVLRGAWLRDQGHLPNSLLKNNGDGTFEDVTEEAGVLSFHPTQAGVWADYDNDGWIDFFVGNESSPGDPHPCELYHNNRNGTFTNVAAQVGVDNVGFVKGAGWGDYDNDGYPDLYLSRLGEPNILFKNEGPSKNPDTPPAWKFTDVTQKAGVAEPLKSFSTWFWDYDNDGWVDLYVADYAISQTDSVSDVAADIMGLPNQGERTRLYRNNRDGTFADVTKEAGLYHVILAMGSSFGDLDNDGWQEPYLGTGDPLLTTLIPNRMFRSVEGKTFQEITTAGGFGHLQKGHGIAFADMDNDGDQDIYEVLGGAYSGDFFASALFENPGFDNRWITLRLEGARTNRAAIGARIKVTVTTPNGDRDIHAIVSAGSSFGGNSLQQEIGLGKATAIKSITIDWPTSKSKQVFENVAMEQIVKIREGENQLVPVELAKYDLSPAGNEGGSCPFHPNGMKAP